MPPDATASKLPSNKPWQLTFTMFEDVVAITGQFAGHIGKTDKLVMVKVSPLVSSNFTGYVPEGVMVVPVAKLVHVVTVISHPGGNPQFPNKQALQS